MQGRVVLPGQQGPAASSCGGLRGRQAGNGVREDEWSAGGGGSGDGCVCGLMCGWRSVSGGCDAGSAAASLCHSPRQGRSGGGACQPNDGDGGEVGGGDARLLV